MQESTVMELVKWFIYLLVVMLIFSLAVFLMQMGDKNSFKQQVNYEIERSGGLTPEAIEAINEYSDTHFDGRFTVDSEKLNEKVSFGETVDYTINATFDIIVFPIPDVHMQFTGTGVSQVR